MDAVEHPELASSSAAPEPTFGAELQDYWAKIPDKWLFLTLLAAWVILFQFIGISSFNFGTTRPSLFLWLYNGWCTPAMDCDQGKLIPWVVAALFWVKRKELMPSLSGVWPSGLIVVALSLAIHIFGYLGQQPRVSMVGLFSGVWGLIGVTWGWRTMLLSTFPMVLFAFCMPLGNLTDPLTMPLRMISVTTTRIVCNNVLDIEVVQRGTELRDAHGKFGYDVAAACSGIRSFMALLAITLTFAMLAFTKIWKRVLMILATIPLVIICNVIRLTVVVLVGQMYGEGRSMWVHDWFGYVTYTISIVVLLGLAHLLKEKPTAAVAS